MKKILLLSLALPLLAMCATNAETQLPKKDIALQLYSLRDDFNINFDATIKVVGEAGYTAI
ncbi:MAG: sugar phosphate isomerase/epimerase, partial [Prevotellaceae bacterium]|nr:sugar phosphate isomerase/epimerase [Prevotellaceae bacterium]